jgi:protein SCO1/2
LAAAAWLAVAAAAAAAVQEQSPPPPRPPSADAPAPADPHAEHRHHQAAAPAGDPEARKYFSDVVLVDQDGREHRFYSDLLAGKTVVINAFFTSCTGVCPVLGGKMAALQKKLGDRLESEVRLLSISVDPETDTQAKLHDYAERFGAREGWYLLGGTKENVDWALYRVGQYVESPEAHTNVMIIGNEPAHFWRKTLGLAPADELMRSLDEVAAEKPTGDQAAGEADAGR